MDKVKISIIIPVYNCEDYLEECLNSVIRQTLRPIEIICVDDGSLDNSDKILERYAREYEYICVYTQENSGAGVARNLGIEKARGEFVCFLDADDFYLDEDALERMYETCIQTGVGVCGSNMKLLRNNNLYDKVSWLDIKENANKILEYKDFQFDYGYTSFLFSRELLKKNMIKFPSYRRFQDPPFLVKAMYTIGRFVFCDTQLYCYREPIMSSRYNKPKVYDLIKGLRENLIFACRNDLKILFHNTLTRIEYEYHSVIFHWVKNDDAEAICMLQDIQNIVRDSLERKDYELRPLCFILNNIKTDITYEEEICKLISESTKIYIYGAGKLAKSFLTFLEKKKLLHKVKGVIVSRVQEPGAKIRGIEIIAVDKLKEELDVAIYIATGGSFHKEIIEILTQLGYRNFHALDTIFLEEI